jgi:two-component system nitrogen regulation response regulator NtrX
LKDKGFTVREAANFDQAILEINKKLPDVAVIDVKLDKGDNDGIELLVHIKKIDEDIPVIKNQLPFEHWHGLISL